MSRQRTDPGRDPGGYATDVTLTPSVSPRFVPYAGLAGLAMLAGLAFGRPELIVLGAPFLLAVMLGVLMASTPRIETSLSTGETRLLEGDELTVTVRLRALTACRRIDVTLHLDPGMAYTDSSVQALSLAAGESKDLSFRLRGDRWGAYDVGRLRLRVRDPLWLVTAEGSVDSPCPVRVYPKPESLLTLIKPAETQVFTGNEVARSRGEGIEFADIRPFVPGDRVRRINWRATARRLTLQVNDQHPERNSDVILLLDTFDDVGPAGRSTLDRTLRSAIGLALTTLRHRDRVGVISFGGMLRWLSPDMGLRQRYRLVESILDTRVQMSYAWRTIEAIPPRTLPPKALVIGLSPLKDDRIVHALLQLRGRGFDIAVVEVEALMTAPSAARTAELATRIFALTRQTVRDRFHQAGVATIRWRIDEPLAGAIEEVRAFRQHRRQRRA